MKAIIAATILGIVLMFAGLFIKEKKTIVSIATAAFLALFGITIYEVVSASPTAPATLLQVIEIGSALI